MKNRSGQAWVEGMSAKQEAAGVAACANKCRVVVHESKHASRSRRAKDGQAAQATAAPSMPPLPILRPLGTVLRPPPQKWPLRRLGLVYAGCQAVAALARQTARPPHPRPTLLAGEVRRRLQEV